MPTTTRGYAYPASTAQVRVWEDVQALAEDIDADVTALETSIFEKPVGRLVASSSQALPDNTATAVLFATEEYDTDNFHSTSSNTARVTPTIAGYYRFTGTVFFEAQSSPVSTTAHIRFNGSTNLAPAPRGVPASLAHNRSVTVMIAMNGSTDYIELVATQDSAGADNTNVSSQFSSVLEWEFVRSL